MRTCTITEGTYTIKYSIFCTHKIRYILDEAARAGGALRGTAAAPRRMHPQNRTTENRGRESATETGYE